jgi:hypothetical protein
MTKNHTVRTSFIAAIIAALPAFTYAQYSPAPPRPYPGLLNDYLRQKDPYMNQWNLGVNVRGRYENKDQSGFTAAGSNFDFVANPAPATSAGDNYNAYYLTRIMPRVGYTSKWWEAFVEGRSSDAIDDERADGQTNVALKPRSLTETDTDLNLHQAYLFVGNHKEFPISAKIGRQEFFYGDQRQLGHFRWNNTARVFDAVKLRWQNRFFGVDAFSGSLVQNDDGNFNESHPDTDLFSGLYFNIPNLAGFTKHSTVEAYFFNRDVDRDSATEDFAGVPAPFRNPAKQDLNVYGIRLKSKPGALGAWDYTLEGIKQGGDRANTGPAASVAATQSAALLDHDAEALIAQIGYTWTENSMQPRLSFTYSYASGDDNPSDGNSGTFQNLFATTHLHYGYMDLSSLQNLHDFRTALNFKPHERVTIAVEHHYQLLDNTRDAWYNVAGVARGGVYSAPPLGISNELGHEVDLVVGWYPKMWLHFEVGLSHYFRGDFIKESISDAEGGSKDSSYVYAQTTLNF